MNTLPNILEGIFNQNLDDIDSPENRLNAAYAWLFLHSERYINQYAKSIELRRKINRVGVLGLSKDDYLWIQYEVLGTYDVNYDSRIEKVHISLNGVDNWKINVMIPQGEKLPDYIRLSSKIKQIKVRKLNIL